MAGLTMEKPPHRSCFLYFPLKYPLPKAAGGTVCSQQDLFPLPGMFTALPKHPAAIPALDGVSLGVPAQCWV